MLPAAFLLEVKLTTTPAGGKPVAPAFLGVVWCRYIREECKFHVSMFATTRVALPTGEVYIG